MEREPFFGDFLGERGDPRGTTPESATGKTLKKEIPVLKALRDEKPLQVCGGLTQLITSTSDFNFT